MKRFTIFAVLAAATTIHADELVLKDGKTVAWTALRDLGDSYEVETPEGVKLEYKKSDVLKFVPKDRARVQKDKAAEVLTGATFTWDKSKKLMQMDLLRSVDAKNDTISGSWKVSGGALQNTTADTWSRLESSFVPPAEYDLNLTLERADGTECFYVGLPVNGTRFAIVVDSNIGNWCGVTGHNRQQVQDTKIGVQGKLLESGKSRQFTIMVRKSGFAVLVDGKDLFAWKGNWPEMSLPDDDCWGSRKKNVIHFGTGLASFKVKQAVITFPR